ncbi:unnamed protein product, partial [Didymodactylos carnosus]
MSTTLHFSRIKTEKNQDGILYKSYLYRLKRSNKNGTEKWVCTRNCCSCSITIKDDVIIGSSGIDDNGTHYPMHDPKLPENVLSCVSSIKKRILEEPTTPIPQIYDQQVKKFRRDKGSAATVPVFDSIRQSLYYTRSSVFPLLPKTLESLVIPQQMAYFFSTSALEISGKSQHWNADGTFRTAPKLFYQSYSIHTWDEYSIKPIVHAALPDKNETSYEILLDRLLSYATEKNVALSPQSILIDFEVASWNAFSRKFPTAMVKGRHFHFAQNIWKKIKKYGLTKLILNNDNARR